MGKMVFIDCYFIDRNFLFSPLSQFSLNSIKSFNKLFNGGYYESYF